MKDDNKPMSSDLTKPMSSDLIESLISNYKLYPFKYMVNKMYDTFLPTPYDKAELLFNEATRALIGNDISIVDHDIDETKHGKQLVLYVENNELDTLADKFGLEFKQLDSVSFMLEYNRYACVKPTIFKTDRNDEHGWRTGIMCYDDKCVGYGAYRFTESCLIEHLIVLDNAIDYISGYNILRFPIFNDYREKLETSSVWFSDIKKRVVICMDVYLKRKESNKWY